MNIPCLIYTLYSWLTFELVVLLQAMSAPRSIFSSCSSPMKQRYGISTFQLNCLIAMSETGRLFGFLSSAAADCLPPFLILLIGLILRSIGHGEQYLCIAYHVDLSYWQLLILNFFAGHSCCWINTYGHLLASRNFMNNDMTNVAPLTSSYSWLTGKIYTCLVESIRGRTNIDSRNCVTYILFNCLVPTFVGISIQILFSCVNSTKYGEVVVVVDMVPIILIVIGAGFYTAFESIAPPFTQLSPQLRLGILVLVTMLPLVVALVMASQSDSESNTNELEFKIDNERELMRKEKPIRNDEVETKEIQGGSDKQQGLKEIAILSVDFWLIYLVNSCGATLGTVYMNNLERISQSHGNCDVSFLQGMASTSGFFGSILLAIFIWCTREKSIASKSRLALLLIMIMIPMPVAFCLLIIINKSNICLYISTAIIGACTGAMGSMTGPLTSEMFGDQNSAINQTFLLTNIPIGILVFGYLAALNYESQGSFGDNMMRNFVLWGCVCMFGTVLSFCLYLRTK